MTSRESSENEALSNLLHEDRRFAPPAAFAAAANVKADAYEEAGADRLAFWAKQADKYLTFSRKWDTVLEWKLPFARWFVGGTINASYQCLDRHVENGRGDRTAYLWEGEPGDTRTITYAELLEQVCRFANALRDLGVKKGDRVGIYMGMVPELPVAMLACARIGAAHSVVFGGFSAEAVADRMNDSGSVLLITQDEAWRRGSTVPLKRNVDEALGKTETIKNVVVVRRTGNEVPMTEGRDHWYHDLVADKPVTSPASM